MLNIKPFKKLTGNTVKTTSWAQVTMKSTALDQLTVIKLDFQYYHVMIHILQCS